MDEINYQKIVFKISKVFRTAEIQISQCPDICDLPENKNTFCHDNEPDFIEAFSAEIK